MAWRNFMDIERCYLEPSETIDSDNPDVIEYARKAVGNEEDDVQKAVKLYYAVRDPVRYDPYSPFYKPVHYTGAFVLGRGRGYCVSKASLLCALGRAAGIPSRVGFATVKNHIATRELIEMLGSNRFVYHGFTEFFLEGKWVKATPAFNSELCAIHRVHPLEFNGRDDSIFYQYNLDQNKYMEYLEYLGSYADVPVDTLIEAWKNEYGKDRVEMWIDAFESGAMNRHKKFEDEEVLEI